MHPQRGILIGAIVLAVAYAWLSGAFVGIGSFDEAAGAPVYAQSSGSRALQKATFAGGCFWCVEADFDKVKGVLETISGYTGGRVRNPTYEEVSAGGTGHTEAVEVVFDPAVVTYDQLLDHYWRNVDPFVAHRQFCDVGSQYRPEIFVHTDAQRTAAEASKKRIQQQFAEPIVVNIANAGPFYRAEAYHQDYHKTHSIQYRYYRWRCGRDARLQEIWRGRT
jgi:peptide-methionine (S)-S-oxide reductase